MTEPLNQFVDRLHNLSVDRTLAAIAGVFKQSTLTVEDLWPYVEFSSDSYRRRRVLACDHFELLVLSWLEGQRTPIHAHGNSQCCVQVLMGEAKEVSFELIEDMRFITHERRFVAGDVTGGQNEDIHVLMPAKGCVQMVTLHAYFPAIDEMQYYSVRDEQLILRDHGVTAVKGAF